MYVYFLTNRKSPAKVHVIEVAFERNSVTHILDKVEEYKECLYLKEAVKKYGWCEVK